MSIYFFNNIESKVYSNICAAIQHLDTHTEVPFIDLKNALDIYKKALSESSYGYMYNQNQIRMRSGFWGCVIDFDMCEEFKNGRIKTDIRIIPEITEVMAIAKKEKNTYEIIRSVYAYFVRNFEYAYDQMNELKYHSAISVFLYRKSVCEGFALALSNVLNRLGISCGIITGYSNLNGVNGTHVWNIVELDGNYYHLDVTWDICTKQKGFDIFDYFFLDDKLAESDHQWSDASIPHAMDCRKEFYIYNGLCCRTEKDCINILISCMKQKRKNIGFRYIGDGSQEIISSKKAERLLELAVREGHFAYRSVSFSVNSTGGTVYYSLDY